MCVCVKESLVLLPKLSKNLCEVLEFSMCLETQGMVFSEEDKDTGLVERASVLEHVQINYLFGMSSA